MGQHPGEGFLGVVDGDQRTLTWTWGRGRHSLWITMLPSAWASSAPRPQNIRSGSLLRDFWIAPNRVFRIPTATRARRIGRWSSAARIWTQDQRYQSGPRRRHREDHRQPSPVGHGMNPCGFRPDASQLSLTGIVLFAFHTPTAARVWPKRIAGNAGL